MRVISGSARGRKLSPPPDSRIRPTADRVKEAIFSLLFSRLGNFESIRVLDLFCGTGALGIEALSRGAAEAVFIDNHAESLALARQNVEACRLIDRSSFVSGQLPAVLARLRREPFDVVFLDPPYRKGLATEVLDLLAESDLLAPGGIVIIEHAADEAVPQPQRRLTLDVTRTYGDTAVSLYTFIDEAH